MLLALGGCRVGLGSNAAVNADGLAAGYSSSLALFDSPETLLSEMIPVASSAGIFSAYVVAADTE